MDYRKINSHIILLGMVIVVGLFSAIVVRMAMLGGGADTGTANLTFVLILGACAVLYLIIVSTLSNSVIPWIMRRLPAPKNTAKQKQPDELPDNPKLNGKTESFCRYSDEVLGDYAAEEDLVRLHTYIAQYARGNMGDIPAKINTTGLEKFELYHYGWNIWNHFRVVQQPETAQWLINVFSSMEGSDPNVVYKKFTHNERHAYKIERKHKIG
jgi:hypothetical protein